MQSGTRALSVAPGTGGLPVTIIGAGLMGHSIAGVFAAAGSRVTLFDTQEAALEVAVPKIREQLARLRQDAACIENIRLSIDLVEAVSGTLLVIEAIREDLTSKQDLVRQVGEISPGAIIATNTSALQIAAVAQDAVDRSLVVGAHWWNPPHLIPLVEIVHSDYTSDEAAEWLDSVLSAAGKTPVHIRKDIPGFVGNRLQLAMWREAFALIDAGVCDAETVDIVVRSSFGLRLAVMGPMENADYVGLDLVIAIQDYLFPHLSTDQEPGKSISRLVEEGNLGRRTGTGFLDWGDNRGAEAANRLENHLMNLTQGSDALKERNGNAN